MFTILYETSFQASHQLKYSGGEPEPLHEHDWKVCAAITSERLNRDELVMDFDGLKALLNSILQEFRDRRLETLGCFQQRNASAESVAQVLYEQLAPRLPNTVRLDYVEVMEAPGCRARYFVNA
ncbi:MAG: 6-carboxytetrahydropterin synthase [Planctomycetaceae bacterium]|nr:6-carboxytetrahydropterin synthase [Planctomycetaceae bacterium]